MRRRSSSSNSSVGTWVRAWGLVGRRAYPWVPVVGPLLCSDRATVTALDTNHPNGVVIDEVERFRPPSDQGEPYDVYIVVSEGRDGALITRTVYAASEDDACQAHQANYDEPVVAVYQ
jgi:hypothetical protein